MNNYTANFNILPVITIFIVISVSSPSFAGGPTPPGVPKKKACNDSLSVVRASNLEFGRIVATAPGTVTISPVGVRSTAGPDPAGGIVMQTAYDLTYGLDGCDYYPVRLRVTGLPASLDGPGISMTADTFILDPVSPITLNSDRTIPTRVNIGGTLTTGNTVTNGIYTTTTPFTITVDARNP